MRTVDPNAARVYLSRLLDEVAGGEEILIAKADTPVARLLPFEPRREPRKPGLKGRIRIADDLDQSLALRGERP